MSPYAPLIMVGGFLAFGMIFVAIADLGDWLRRSGKEKQRREE